MVKIDVPVFIAVMILTFGMGLYMKWFIDAARFHVAMYRDNRQRMDEKIAKLDEEIEEVKEIIELETIYRMETRKDEDR